ncbi:hypothetical protein L208DRAFT_334009 [Tricholoma matsutake]|nr:hypothetical protein L208DRAFT_334009 [Tricholoma matsutake 945]
MVMALKVWILYDKDIWILFVLVPLLIAELVVMGLVGHFFVPSNAGHFDNTGSFLPGCHSSVFPRIITIYTVPPILTVSIMFGLILYKCMANFRIGVQGRMPIVALFLRDGIVWFILVYSL